MTVNNVNALQTLGAVQGSQTSVKPEEAVQERFDKLMAKMGDQLTKMKQPPAAKTAPQVPNQNAVQNAQESVQTKDTVGEEEVEQTDTVEETEDVKTSADDAKDAVEQDGGKTVETRDDSVQDTETQETVERAAEELVQEIADVMDIPLEKVEEVMETLGLTAIDLFDPANLKQLLLNLTESTDEMALVTDETLYGNLQEIFRTVRDIQGTLQEELGLNEEELKVLMEQISEEQKQPAEAGQPAVEKEQTALTAETEGLTGKEPEVSVEGMKDYTVSVQKESGTVQVKVTVDDQSGTKHVSEQLTDTAKPETQPVLKKETMADTGHKGESQAGEQNAANPFMHQLSADTEKVETPVERPVYMQPETNQIMDQIVEYMKINIKPETQELEMQLHPASLGTVHVQIAAKDGVITAQFAAQNETVKTVLETQMIQLKEQFEEQGIKVEAVEVTVANHGFGEQFNNGQEAADQQRETAKKGTRRINLNLEELEEDGLEALDDSEKIAVEMMRANGSTVNYTV